MKIENSFVVNQPVEQAWETLLDVPLVAGCMPGVSLTDACGTDRYRIIGKVGLGPVQLVMIGEISIVSTDAATRTARLSGKGSDQKGRGTSTATVVFVMRPGVDDPRSTRVDVVTDLELAGSIAQYGRGSGIINAVAGQIVTQFAANLQKTVAAQQTQGESAAAEQRANLGVDSAAVPAHAMPKAEDSASTASVGGFGVLLRALWSLLWKRLSTRDGANR